MPIVPRVGGSRPDALGRLGAIDIRKECGLRGIVIDSVFSESEPTVGIVCSVLPHSAPISELFPAPSAPRFPTPLLAPPAAMVGRCAAAGRELQHACVWRLPALRN